MSNGSPRSARAAQGRMLARCSLAVLLACAPGGAGELARSRYVFRNYGIDQGLGDLTVTCITQDRTGFLWVGTQDGLYQFDGQSFVRFGRAEGLPSSIVTDVQLGRDGSLWVGTNLGIAHRQGTRFSAYGPDRGVPPDSIPPQGIATGRDGRVYVATDHGLRVLAETRFEGFAPPATRGRITAVLASADGSIWFGDNSGKVGRLAGEKLDMWEQRDGIPHERIDALCTGRNGELWIRTAHHLIVGGGGRAGGFVERGQGLPVSSYFGSILLDRSGGLWVPTDLGLAHLDQRGWKVVGHAQGLSADSVNAVFEDREGLLWIGLAGAGLDCWMGYPAWTCVTTSEGLSNDAIWCIGRDTEGALWVGTDYGINRLDPLSGAWRAWRDTDGLGGQCVYALLPDVRGGVWAGLYPGGITYVDSRRGPIEHYDGADGLDGDRIWDMAITTDGTLWVATTEGLYRAAVSDGRRRFSSVIPPGGDRTEPFWALLIDRQGRLWAGGQRGLAVLERAQWRRLTQRDGLREDGVGYLAEAADGDLWLGYYEAIGASRLHIDGNTLHLQHFDSTNGLASDAAWALACDAQGRAWIGTNRGLNMIRGDENRRYGRADGLFWSYVNALWVDADGSVWIGTSKGLARFLTGEQPRSSEPPNVVLLSATLGRRSLPLDRPGEASYDDRTFAVAFTGLAFHKPEETIFRYRLIGLEETPTETDHREARYPMLPPGTYTFEVESRNADGLWSPEAARFEFTISPPWYRTPAALLSAVIGLIALVGAAHKIRLRRVVEQKKRLGEAVTRRTEELQKEKATVEEQSRALMAASEERRRFYAMLVHDLKNPLTPILGGLEIIESELHPESRVGIRAVEVMRNAAARLRFLIDTYVSALRTAVVDRPEMSEFRVLDMVGDLALSYGPAAQKRGLKLLINGTLVDERWALERGGCLVRAPADAIYRAVENLLSNALKYATGEIRIWIREDGDHEVGLVVENDGMTISDADKEKIFKLYEQLENAKPGSGVGLASARRQIEALGGRLLVKDVEPSGVRFEIWIPRAPDTDEKAADPRIG